VRGGESAFAGEWQLVPNTEVVGTSAWIAENAQRYEGAVTYDLNNIHPYTFQTSNSSGNADWKSDTYYLYS
jgi:hypothetical protein